MHDLERFELICKVLDIENQILDMYNLDPERALAVVRAVNQMHIAMTIKLHQEQDRVEKLEKRLMESEEKLANIRLLTM